MGKESAWKRGSFTARSIGNSQERRFSAVPVFDYKNIQIRWSGQALGRLSFRESLCGEA
jgi:hypothetical protein